MTAAGLYLIVVVVLGLAASAVRLPPLVGYLAAGLVLSAAGAPRLEVIGSLAELGLALLLFKVGLRLRPWPLMRRRLLATAATSTAVLTCLGVGIVAAVAAVLEPLEAPSPAGALLVGFALALSSVAVPVRLLEARDDTRAVYGRLVSGVLVLQVVAAVLLLTILRAPAPSPWAGALIALWPVSRLLGAVLDRIDHREMRTLFGIATALVLGYALFEAVAVDGRLGALVIGALLARHPAAKELGGALSTVEDALVACLFVSIGLATTLSVSSGLLAVVMLAAMPLRPAVHAAVVRAGRMRRRTSVLSGLLLSPYSEMALVLVAVGIDLGLLDRAWAPGVALGVSLSFIVSAAVNRAPARLVRRLSEAVPRRPRDSIHPEDRPLDLTEVSAVVFGMGRVGRSTYTRLYDDGMTGVLGIDNDATKVAALRRRGFNVLEADATDQGFWERLDAVHATTAVLAIHEPGANVNVLEWLNRSSFDGEVLAVARTDDEARALRRAGADTVLNIEDALGSAVAQAITTGDAPQGFDSGSEPAADGQDHSDGQPENARPRDPRDGVTDRATGRFSPEPTPAAG
ncbi:MAG: cation:proton antiporter [Actinomyces sp.]|uniref:cation:proton antiporter family protein n=1 Tax=Actinomyces sp. TaxID=29317 RepID=UPI0026DB4508|nr:cation:proton antiporter family protein [Actinomyces sp.]MDO4244328.1 cation:proton antiporter [Actinomyces sp.]